MHSNQNPLTVLQILPALESGGVERGTLEVGHYLANKGHRSLVISAGGRMVKQLLEEGSEHFTWTIGKKSLWTLRFIPKLVRFLKDNKVDVIHVRSRFPAWICKIALSLLPAAKRPVFITTVHGQYSANRYSRIMTEGDEVIVISKAIETYVRQNYPVNGQLHLNYRGIDPTQFSYQYQPSDQWLSAWYAQYPHLASKFVITLPARITRWKGQEDLCHILAALKNNIPNIHALVVGEIKREKKDFFNELKINVQKMDLASFITFTDHRSDVREIMAVSDVVLSLSHEPEAFGRVPIEALAMGVPVAAYAHGGVAEQLAKVFPEGAVLPKNYLGVARKIQAWHDKKPVVLPTTAFRLQTMLDNTLRVYQTALRKKQEKLNA